MYLKCCHTCRYTTAIFFPLQLEAFFLYLSSEEPANWETFENSLKIIVSASWYDDCTCQSDCLPRPLDCRHWTYGQSVLQDNVSPCKKTNEIYFEGISVFSKGKCKCCHTCRLQLMAFFWGSNFLVSSEKPENSEALQNSFKVLFSLFCTCDCWPRPLLWGWSSWSWSAAEVF